MAERDPQYGDLCRDEAGVIWKVWMALDDVVYVAPSFRNNSEEVCNALDGEYETISRAETAAGGDHGAEDDGGCWLVEDWAALPAVAAYAPLAVFE